ncbi:MAG: NADP oxidoreductase [Deltaproteobacteria bacterium]|nr:MAG: NADP oxidoreductase [Deltaproteobacteria bacterium]TMB15855.1 MAG: NADP oxidoreductase [Deltaproteobacteria bacterium]
MPAPRVRESRSGHRHRQSQKGGAMTVGIIGAGKIGAAIARHLTKSGYDVIVSNRRGPESLRPLVAELGPKAKAGTVEQAAAASVIFLTVTWSQLPGVLSKLPAWDGRIAIDATNHYVADGSGFRLLDLGRRTSSEVVAEMVPGAKLVKAFNTLFHAILAADPREAGGRRVIFLSGDDASAKGQVSEMIDRLGFAPIDLGRLAEGGKMQQAGGPLASVNLLRRS